jgi:hypothetical protein
MEAIGTIRLRVLTLAFAFCLWPMLSGAGAESMPVDLELAFVVDASGSIDEAETQLQRRGYAEALAHPRILKAISGGFLGRIAVSFIEFAAYECERLSVPWMMIDGPRSAKEVADLHRFPTRLARAAMRLPTPLLSRPNPSTRTPSKARAASSISRAMAQTRWA